MRASEYIEGRKATENFEEGMKALFKVPKAKVANPKKKNRTQPKAASVRKAKRSDRD